MSYWNRQFKKHNNKYGLSCPGKGNDLSRRVLMALTAAGFFMTPFSAYFYDAVFGVRVRDYAG